MAEPKDLSTIPARTTIKPNRPVVALWALFMASFVVLAPFLGSVSASIFFVVFFGTMTVAAVMAFGDKVEITDEGVVVTTRRLMVKRSRYVAPALMPDQLHVMVMIPFGTKFVQMKPMPGRRLSLWPYLGHQDDVVKALLAAPARVSGSGRPPSTGRSARTERA